MATVSSAATGATAFSTLLHPQQQQQPSHHEHPLPSAAAAVGQASSSPNTHTLYNSQVGASSLQASVASNISSTSQSSLLAGHERIAVVSGSSLGSLASPVAGGVTGPVVATATATTTAAAAAGVTGGAAITSAFLQPQFSAQQIEQHQQHQQQQQLGQGGKKGDAPVSSTATSKLTKAQTARHNNSWDYVAKTMVAGGVAGMTAKTLIAPLDRVKILFQASNPKFEKYAGTWTGVFRAGRDIHQLGGMKSLFQGNSATIMRIFPYAAIKFMAYEQFRHLLMPTRRDETPYLKLIAGSMAGVTSVFATYPLDLIRVRLAYETTATPYMLLVNKIYNEPAGQHRPANSILPSWRIMNFYRGFLCSVAGMIPYAGVSFFTHDVTQELCRTYLPWTLKPNQDKGLPDVNGDYSRPELRTFAELACGGVAGAVSMTSSYPLEVVRRKMQVAGALDPKVFEGMWATAKKLYVAKGARGFFVGLSIGYLKVTPMVAVSFTVYERMKTLLQIN